MQALIFQRPGVLTLERVARCEPGAGEVVLRVDTACICGTDVRIVSGRKTRDVRRGHPIGHECAGVIASVGEGVTGLNPGQRVAVHPVVSCGACRFCHEDRENLCPTHITLGYQTDGAFAEFMPIPAQAVRRGNLFPLPDEVDLPTGAILEPLACCINGQHEMGLGQDASAESLLILGAGPIGLLHMLIARARIPTLSSVTIVEPQSRRREFARRLGATQVLAPEEFRVTETFDAAILAVGVPALIDVALHAVRPAGSVSFFAGFDAGTAAAVDVNAIHYKQVRVTGASESRRRDFAEALNLVHSGKLDPAPLITHQFTLNEYEEAFRRAGDGSGLKVALQM